VSPSGRELRAPCAERLELEHDQRSGGVLRERLIDLQRNLRARGHLPLEQVRLDQLVRDASAHQLSATHPPSRSTATLASPAVLFGRAIVAPSGKHLLLNARAEDGVDRVGRSAAQSAVGRTARFRTLRRARGGAGQSTQAPDLRPVREPAQVSPRRPHPSTGNVGVLQGTGPERAGHGMPERSVLG
jgi:hypothetical protein